MMMKIGVDDEHPNDDSGDDDNDHGVDPDNYNIF